MGGGTLQIGGDNNPSVPVTSPAEVEEHYKKLK
jgi:hypothetical protein